MNLILKFKRLLGSCDKNPLKSKTLWVNGLTLIVGILALVQGVASPEWLIPVLAGVNIVLRFLTTGGITPGNKIVTSVTNVVNEVTNVVNKEIKGIRDAK